MPKRVHHRSSVFVSYAMRDKPRIKAVIEQLRKRGLIGDDEEFVDPSELMVQGSSIRGELKEAIRSASKVIVLWSGAGAESQFVNYEAAMAKALGKPMVLVIPEGGTAGVPLELADMPIVELLPKGP